MLITARQGGGRPAGRWRGGRVSVLPSVSDAPGTIHPLIRFRRNPLKAQINCSKDKFLILIHKNTTECFL